MPEIVIEGIRYTSSGIQIADAALLEKERKSGRLKLWAAKGTPEECEKSWRDFILADTPDWKIWGG